MNGGSSKGGGSAAAGSASAAATTATVTGKRPKNAFELFCVETRPHLEEKLRAQAAEEDADRTDEEGGGSGAAVTTKSVDNKLARAWKALSERERDEWERRSISLAAGSSGKVGGRAGGKKKDAAARSTATEKPAADNDDEEDEDMDDDADEGAGAGGDTTIAESARGDGDGDADEDVDMEAPDSSDEMRAPKRGA